jgi:hypothetical protein
VQSLRLVDAGTGKVLAALEPPRDVSSTSRCFSPDGTRLAVATANHTIHVWDLRAIRRGLAEIGLDWDLPAYPPAPVGKGPEAGRAVEPLRVQLAPGDFKEMSAVKLNVAFQSQARERLYAQAARLYAEVFAAEPGLADDLGKPHRYNAACAAALAGCGQGKDAPPDGAERARLRKQALDWLNADLARCKQFLARQSDKVRAAVRQLLLHWRDDADLAGVRGDAIEKLPEAERPAWRQLWADVEQTLKQAGRCDADDAKKQSSK